MFRSEKKISDREEREFGVTGKPHPLLIPSVAFNILRYLNYSELKELRLVCTQWEYEASHLLKEKTLIILEREDQIEKYLKEFPQTNYSCVSFAFGSETFIKSPLLQEFFFRYGGDLKSLKLHTSDWSNWQLWELLSEKLPSLQELSLRIFIPKYGHLFPDSNERPSLPNIKKLSLSFCIDHTDIYFTNPTILKELFLALPNLEVLACPNWPTIIPPSTNVSTLVFNVILSEVDIKFNNLSHLLVTASLSNAELYLLLNKQFPLRELHLELSRNVRGVYLLCLLASLEDTLETLSLTFPYHYDVCQFETFPRLKNLKLLSLLKFQGSLESMAKHCTSLKKLVLSDVYLQEDDENAENFNENDDTDFTSNHTLEELSIQDKDDSPIPAGQMKELAKLFPNLKRLTMQNVNDDVLNIVFAKFTQLEEFIAQGKFTDSGVTGFPEEICKILIHEEKTISCEKADQLRFYSYIGNLRNLKRLFLKSNRITFLSVIYGVRQCKHLEYKRISSYNIL